MIKEQQIMTRTASGKLLNLNDIQEDDIEIQDIAHALARQCRFGGHVNNVEIYSVAEHLVLCSDLMKKLVQYEDFDFELGIDTADNLDFYRAVMSALLHDAAECYLTDVITPVKKYLEEYMVMEEYVQQQVEKIIEQKTGFDLFISSMPEKNNGVWIVDKLALCIEARFLTCDPEEELKNTYLPQLPDYAADIYHQCIYDPETVKGLLPSKAQEEFLNTYEYYKHQMIKLGNR